MGISALLASQILDASATGRSVLTGADASAIRTTLGLGTLATQSATITDYLTIASAASTYQPLDSDLTSIAALSTTAFGRGLLTEASATTARSTLGLGTLATQSPTGTPSASTFLRGDFSWQTIDLSGYVPYTGATGAVNLGSNAFTASQATLSAGTLNGTVLDIAQTWGGTGTYTGIKYNVTDSGPANAASLLLDLQVGGSSKARVKKTGTIRVTNGVVPTNGGIGSGGVSLELGFDNYGIGYNSNGSPVVVSLGVQHQTLGLNTIVGSGGSYGWSTSSEANQNAVFDLALYRDAAQTLAQRNGLNPQVHRVYNTFTDASNYERGKVAWESNVLRIGTEKAGTGSARALELQTDGVTRLTVGTNSNRILLFDITAGRGGQTSVATNTVFGVSSLDSATLTGGNNTAVGHSAAFSNTSGTDNTAFGVNALYSNTNGIFNTAIGVDAFRFGSGGSSNVAVGASSMRFNSSGGNNVAVGVSSLRENTTASNSVAVGVSSLRNSTGGNNIGIGYQAGDAITTGTNNIAIGYDVDVDSATASNQINIGNVYYHDRIAGAKTFSGNVTVSAVNLVTDTTTGTKIGTGTTQKLGFYNSTPVVQPTAVADATDAASVITQLNALLSRMRDLGLIAT